MNSKFDTKSMISHSVNNGLFKINSSQSLNHLSLNSSILSLSPTHSETSHSEDSSIAENYRDDQLRSNQISDGLTKSSLNHQPIKDCKNNNKLSFGISRLLSSKSSSSKGIDNNHAHQGTRAHSNQHHVNLSINDSNKVDKESLKTDHLLNNGEKSIDSVLRLPVHRYHSSSFNYSSPFTWLSPQMATMMPKERLMSKSSFFFNKLK